MFFAVLADELPASTHNVLARLGANRSKPRQTRKDRTVETDMRWEGDGADFAPVLAPSVDSYCRIEVRNHRTRTNQSTGDRPPNWIRETALPDSIILLLIQRGGAHS